jgi:hypothetical protein
VKVVSVEKLPESLIKLTEFIAEVLRHKPTIALVLAPVLFALLTEVLYVVVFA